MRRFAGPVVCSQKRASRSTLPPNALLLATELEHANAHLTHSHQSPEPFCLRIASWVSYYSAHKAGRLVRRDRQTNYRISGMTLSRVKEPEVLRVQKVGRRSLRSNDMICCSSLILLGRRLDRPDTPGFASFSKAGGPIFGYVLVKHDHGPTGSATSSSAWFKRASRASRTACQSLPWR